MAGDAQVYLHSIFQSDALTESTWVQCLKPNHAKKPPNIFFTSSRFEREIFCQSDALTESTWVQCLKPNHAKKPPNIFFTSSRYERETFFTQCITFCQSDKFSI